MHLRSNRDKNIERRNVKGRLSLEPQFPNVNCACYLFPSIIRHVCIFIGVISYCMFLI